MPLVTANAPESVALRQRKILEDAIAEVESFYAPPAPLSEHASEGAIDPLSDFLDEVSSANAQSAVYSDEADYDGNNQSADHDVDTAHAADEFSAIGACGTAGPTVRCC